MTHTIRIEVYDRDDLIDRALQLTDDDGPCPGGPQCPRCRLAKAAFQLGKEMELPIDYANGMLQLMTYGRPDKRALGPWEKEEADEVLRAMKGTCHD